ncbi:hypothetical protein VA599_02440 [Chromobacterium sp. TRC.1.1.SA]|uniref:XRE family transcriptional regulator n=1 Tax=Chromobacterium indicum TaxID=3110228 RepID=A0ABV0CEQ3_9NEIS
MTRPFANFHCRPDDLYRALCFGDIEEMAAELGVSAQQLAYWRRGREPVPKAVFLWLNHRSDTTLGKQFGPFWGFRLSRYGEALECPATGVRIPYDEIAMLPEYRRFSAGESARCRSNMFGLRELSPSIWMPPPCSFCAGAGSILATGAGASLFTSVYGLKRGAFISSRHCASDI